MQVDFQRDFSLILFLKRRLAIFLIVALMTLMVSGCQKAPIKIGYLADLSEKTSQLGVDARNALLLRIDQVNQLGGINGRKIEIVIKNDLGDPQEATKQFDAFKAEGVSYVIGPLTSSVAESALKAQSESLLVVSPSVSGNLATGMDDFFLRTCQLNTQQAKELSDFALEQGIKDIQIIFTEVNRDYTQTLVDSFIAYFEAGGGSVLGRVGYNTSDDLKQIAEEALAFGSHNTLIATHAIDTAVIQQHIRKLDTAHQSLGIQWAMTNDLVENGGRAIEGMYFVGNYMAKEPTKAYLDFTAAFKKRYNYEATFITLWTYDAIEVLLYGLKASGAKHPTAVKTAILEKGDFEGIDQPFTIDKMGDTTKRYSIYQLVNGKFVPH